MDPNANLQEQESILTRKQLDSYDRVRLFELRSALQQWLHSGGFAPDWSKAPTARQHYGK